MKSITVNLFQAWFTVDTIHGYRLETVLRDTGDQTGEYYVDMLGNMLDAEIPSYEKQTVGCVDFDVNGYVSFMVGATTPEELQIALVRCDKVVGKWIVKHRVNEMVEN